MFGKKKKQQQHQQHNPDELLNDLMNNINTNQQHSGQQGPFPNMNPNQGGQQGGFSQFDMNQNNQQPQGQPNPNFNPSPNQNPNQSFNNMTQGNQPQNSQPSDFGNQQFPSPQQNGFPNPMDNQQQPNQSSQMSGFDFPDYSSNNQDIDQRINNLDFISQGTPTNDGESNFQIEEPKNLQEAKQYIYKLVEKIHYLEATLVSVSSNYDNERRLAKKQGSSLGNNSKQLIDLIQDVLQQEKYKYEKDNGPLGEKSFSELIVFLKDNLQKTLSVEKSKNAKLFTMYKEMEKKNGRLESQLSMSNTTSSPSNNANQEGQSDNVYQNVSNIDKINSILGNQSNSTPLDTPNEAPKQSSGGNQEAVPDKLKNIQEDVASFNSEINNITLHKNEEAILRAIGRTGLDNNDKLLQEVQEIKGNMNPNSFKTMVYNYRKKMIDKKLIQTHPLDLPIKGYRNVELFELTDIGRAMYQELYSQPPVESYLVKRKNQHTSYEHAFTIEKIAEQLLLNKYEVLTDEKDLRYPVNVDGKKYHVEFDLIAKKNGEEFYIEVEMGTTKQADFNDKCDKNYAFNKEKGSPIVIVSPSKQKTEQNFKKVNNWMNARGGYKALHKEKKLKMLLPYFDEVKSNRWKDKLEYFIDLTS